MTESLTMTAQELDEVAIPSPLCSLNEPGLTPNMAWKSGFVDNEIRKRWPFVYLAVPYSHPNPEVPKLRFEAVTKAAAWLMTVYGWNVLSPITHSHPLHLIGGMRGDWNFWKQVDTEFLQCSNRIVIFTLPGWRDSVGVTAELKIAVELGLPKQYLNLVDGQYELADEPGPDNILPFSLG